MEEIEISSYGKINLSLDIVNKRPDGYHNIESIMQSIDLKDTLKIKKIEKGLELSSNTGEIPLDSNNIVYKCHQALENYTKKKLPAAIHIEKNIPVAAGLAGGSTNGAAALKGLNTLYNLNLSLEELQALGGKVGADIPFTLQGGTALAKGIGEKLEKLDRLDMEILLVNPNIKVSTPKVYQALKMGKDKRETKIDEILKDLEKKDLKSLAENMYNIMEGPVIEIHPEIAEIKATMKEEKALGSLMSGSGPTVFGIFENLEDLERCKRKLEKKYKNVYKTKAI